MEVSEDLKYRSILTFSLSKSLLVLVVQTAELVDTEQECPRHGHSREYLELLELVSHNWDLTFLFLIARELSSQETIPCGYCCLT